MNFKIVVPTFNTEAWIARCLFSIYSQVHKDWECVVINDASTDGTKEVIDSLDFVKHDKRFTVIHNSKNLKALKNIVSGYKSLKTQEDPESVLMVVDGDDFLFSEYALLIVQQAYEQTNCVLTYGNHVHHPTGGKSNCEPFPAEIVMSNSFREYKFISSHLRTYKSKLWHMIDDNDLKDENGEYYAVGLDVAIMLPMLEMAGMRTIFIPNILYCYNRFNPLSDDVINQSEQHRVEMRVRSSKKYDRRF